MLESHEGLALIVQNKCNQIEIVIKDYSAQLNIFPTSRKNSEGKPKGNCLSRFPIIFEPTEKKLWFCKGVSLSEGKLGKA